MSIPHNSDFHHGLLGLLLVLLGVVGCGSSAPIPPKNVIVISVDTLRADHMSLYGYPRTTTPNLDRFAKTGVTFDRARAQWPKTVPSMVSMFTGRLPHVTGVMFASRGQYVSDDELLLAEVAQQQGLNTGAVVSNAVLGAATNFGQGFETYTETYKLLRGDLGHRADTVTAQAERWLRTQTSDRPFLLWVHYVDPHATYQPPAEYAEPYFRDEYYDPTPLRLNDEDGNLHGGVAGRFWRRNGGQRELGWYVANYDGEIAYTDAQVGRLLDSAEEMGFMSDSLIVFTADHGESLGEHNFFFEHGQHPYNATAWVPLVVYWPGVPEPGLRVTYPVGLVNLLPSVVDLMDWDLDGEPLSAASFVPVLRGEQDRVDDYVVVESGATALRPDEFLRSIEDARWKLIHIPAERPRRGMQRIEFELYETRIDPMETNNIVDEHPDLTELMKQVLAERLADAGQGNTGSGQTPRYSEEEIENLRTLGYIR